MARQPVQAEVTPPPSKSITHRALIAAALCPTPTRLLNPLEAEDTRLTAAALRSLGASIAHSTAEWKVRGFPGGLPGREPSGPEPVLHLGNSGTSLRLLLPIAALARQPFILDGVPRLRQRPVGPQVRALEELGARIRWLGRPGYPPVEVCGPLAGGTLTLDAGASSQLLSGLLMAAPAASGGVEVHLTALSSGPYIDLTRSVLAAFGVRIQVLRPGVYRCRPSRPVSPGQFRIEADASAAAFLLAAGVMTGGRMLVRGVGADSLQGDRVVLDLLARMGCRTASGPDWMEASGPPRAGLVADLNATPDLVPPLFAVALFAPSSSRFTGIGHLRLKESDRIAALAAEAARLGARVIEERDALGLEPARLSGAAVSAHADHRIAMALAVVGLGLPGMHLDDPGCVGKSYPGFFRELAVLAGG
ncbi:MAG: 3-phosphoshikimate 1-carboxyvinyltransferase [Acidobacteriota bacterium]